MATEINRHIRGLVGHHERGSMEELVAMEIEVAYESILGQSKRRLLELRTDWSEMGALHQLLDELACHSSFYWYIRDYDGLFMEYLEKNEEYTQIEEIHPRADELIRQDEVFRLWIEANPRASEILPYISRDFYLTKLSKQRTRLYELRDQEDVSELGSLYTLLDEVCAEMAYNRDSAKRATWRFFEKQKAA